MTGRVAVMVLGSAWFIPVSCSLTMVAGGQSGLFSLYEVRELHPGEAPPVYFPLVAEGAGGEPRFVRISDWPELKKQTPTPRLQPSQPTGEVRSDWAVDHWRVIEEPGQPPIIEVGHHDDDFSLRGRYRVKDGDPVPLRLEISGPAQAMSLLAKLLSGSLVVALGIFSLGRRLRRRLLAKQPGVQTV